MNKHSGRTSLSDHFLPIFLFQNLLRPPLLGFELRGDVFFSQSGDDCPVILCPVIPYPHFNECFVKGMAMIMNIIMIIIMIMMLMRYGIEMESYFQDSWNSLIVRNETFFRQIQPRFMKFWNCVNYLSKSISVI